MGPAVGSGSGRVTDSGANAAERQGLEASQHDAVAEPRAVVEQGDVRETLQQHLEDDPALKTCKRRAHAVVDAPPEGQVGALGAADIEAVWVFERIRVAVGSADQDNDVVPFPHLGPVHLAVRKRAPERRLRRRIVAQQLFDRGRDQARILL